MTYQWEVRISTPDGTNVINFSDGDGVGGGVVNTPGIGLAKQPEVNIELNQPTNCVLTINNVYTSATNNLLDPTFNLWSNGYTGSLVAGMNVYIFHVDELTNVNQRTFFGYIENIDEDAADGQVTVICYDIIFKLAETKLPKILFNSHRDYVGDPKQNGPGRTTWIGALNTEYNTVFMNLPEIPPDPTNITWIVKTPQPYYDSAFGQGSINCTGNVAYARTFSIPTDNLYSITAKVRFVSGGYVTDTVYQFRFVIYNVDDNGKPTTQFYKSSQKFQYNLTGLNTDSGYKDFTWYPTIDTIAPPVLNYGFNYAVGIVWEDTTLPLVVGTGLGGYLSVYSVHPDDYVIGTHRYSSGETYDSNVSGEWGLSGGVWSRLTSGDFLQIKIDAITDSAPIATSKYTIGQIYTDQALDGQAAGWRNVIYTDISNIQSNDVGLRGNTDTSSGYMPYYNTLGNYIISNPTVIGADSVAPYSTQYAIILPVITYPYAGRLSYFYNSMTVYDIAYKLVNNLSLYITHNNSNLVMETTHYTVDVPDSILYAEMSQTNPYYFTGNYDYLTCLQEIASIYDPTIDGGIGDQYCFSIGSKVVPANYAIYPEIALGIRSRPWITGDNSGITFSTANSDTDNGTTLFKRILSHNLTKKYDAKVGTAKMMGKDSAGFPVYAELDDTQWNASLINRTKCSLDNIIVDSTIGSFDQAIKLGNTYIRENHQSEVEGTFVLKGFWTSLWNFWNTKATTSKHVGDSIVFNLTIPKYGLINYPVKARKITFSGSGGEYTTTVELSNIKDVDQTRLRLSMNASANSSSFDTTALPSTLYLGVPGFSAHSTNLGPTSGNVIGAVAVTINGKTYISNTENNLSQYDYNANNGNIGFLHVSSWFPANVYGIDNPGSGLLADTITSYQWDGSTGVSFPIRAITVNYGPTSNPNLHQLGPTVLYNSGPPPISFNYYILSSQSLLLDVKILIIP